MIQKIKTDSDPADLALRLYRYTHTLGEFQRIIDLEVNPSRDSLPGLSSESHLASSDWDRGLGYDGARALSKTGWPEKLAEIDTLAARRSVSSDRVSHNSDWCHDVAGYFPDVGAYLDGDPEYMLMQSPRELPARVINFMIDIGGNCGITADSLSARGQVVFEAIRALELVGYSTGVSISNYSLAAGYSRGAPLATYAYLLKVSLKRPGEYLDPSVAAYFLCCPSAFRRLCFRHKELTDEASLHGVGGGYGRSSVMPDGLIPPDTVFLPSLQDNISADDARADVKQKLLAQGIAINL